MRNQYFIFAAVIASFLLAVNSLSAQEPKLSPHGDINVACDVCHNPESWVVKPAQTKFDHTTTKFPLEGRHRTVGCRDCHKDLTFANTPVNCYQCHQEAHSGQFGNRCEVCHTTDNWLDLSRSLLEHSRTRFPLQGVHRNVDCLSCHSGGRFAGTPLTCFACHNPQFTATQNPSHVQAGFSTDCSSCHSLNQPDWQGGEFQHPATFPLSAGHATANCSECHTGDYSRTSAMCSSCHLNDYNRTTNPNHNATSFPTSCDQCHSTQGWQPATFDHSINRFALQGAHRSVDCSKCHFAGRFTGTPSDCWSCHRGNFDGVSEPNHIAGQFDPNCTVCHSMEGWTPATFDHSQTDFPLTGAHVEVNCATCHVNGQFNGLPDACIACHQADYNGANDPSHRNQGLPDNCEICHTTANWNSNFDRDHDRQSFPIYSGEHRGEWNRCNECHLVPGNYNSFSCIDCHEHNNRGEIDREHREVNGYSYQSSECYRCHRDGGDDFRMPDSPRERIKTDR